MGTRVYTFGGQKFEVPDDMSARDAALFARSKGFEIPDDAIADIPMS